MKKKSSTPLCSPILTRSSSILLVRSGCSAMHVVALKVRSRSNNAFPDLSCPRCKRCARVKDRPVVSYVDLPFGGVPITIKWKKHRLRCPNKDGRQSSFTLSDHRIAAKGCMVTTRAASGSWNRSAQESHRPSRPGALLCLGRRQHRGEHLWSCPVGGRHQAPQRDDGNGTGRGTVCPPWFQQAARAGRPRSAMS